MAAEAFHDFGGDVGDAAIVFAIHVGDEGLGHGGEVLLAFAQGRQMDVEDVEAVEEVLAQLAAADGLLRHLIGGGDDADVDFEFGAPAEAANLGVFEDAQQLGLRGHGHFADLVEQQGAALGHLEASGAAFGGSGERAFLVAEELAFDERLRQRGAIDGDEGTLAAGTEIVQGVGHQFLAGAALAGDEYACPAGTGLLQEGKNFLHAGRVAHQGAQRPFVYKVALQHAFFGAEAGLRSGTADQDFERGGEDGFLEEPEGPELVHRPDGGFDIAVGGQDDGGRHFAAFAEALQEAEAVEARHVEIGEDHVGREIVEFFERLVAVAGGLRGHTPGGDHGGETGPLTRLVVDNEHFQTLVQSLLPLYRQGTVLFILRRSGGVRENR